MRLRRFYSISTLSLCLTASLLTLSAVARAQDAEPYVFLATTDGSGPVASLIQGKNGDLYGTTPQGGAIGVGTVFKVKADGSHFTVLHSFNGTVTDGAYPTGGLLLGKDGYLYGTV